MRFLPALRRRPEPERSDPFISVQDWAGLLTQFAYNGNLYTVVGQTQENIAPSFSGLAQLAYKQDGIVYACMALRQLILAEARFAFRERRNGRAGNLFTTAALAPLEIPWSGATTGDLITRMELYASLAGNWFGTNRYGGIRTLRPDWVTLIVGSDRDPEVALVDPDAEVVGYSYRPGGYASGRDPIIFLPEEVAHYAPMPDPEARFRGMSWLTPVIREVMADKAYTDHKIAFMENAATPNLHVSLDVPDIEAYEAWVGKFRSQHESVANAYKTLFTTSAVDVTPVGMNFQQMDFKVTQGAGETRIAAAARTPPALVGLSEGLQGSSLNAGNFEAATKSFVDMFARPEWRNMAGSLAPLIQVPPGSELWYDDRDIPALQEDIKKAGERLQAQATSINTLWMTGFDPDAVVDAVTSGDLSRLTGKHSGLQSVQGQPGTPQTPAPASNGSNGSRSDDLLDELVRLSQQPRQLETHIHVPEQPPAQVTVPVTVEAPEPSVLTVEAARSPDVNVTVEPARVEFADGSIRVDSPIRVEPAQVTVEAARQPDVNVTVEAAPAPDVNVTVEPADVRVEAAPAPDVNVTVERLELPEGAVNVTVEPAQVNVEAAPVPEVHIHPPEQRPRKAIAERDKDGKLTVTYEEAEDV